VDAARPGAAPAEARVWRPPARRLPPDPVRERHLLPAVGDRVRHRPRQALLLLPALRLPLVTSPGPKIWPALRHPALPQVF